MVAFWTPFSGGDWLELPFGWSFAVSAARLKLTSIAKMMAVVVAKQSKSFMFLKMGILSDAQIFFHMTLASCKMAGFYT